MTVRRRRSLTGIDSRDAAGDKGLAQPLTPYDPQPRVGAAIRDGLSICSGSSSTSSLPRGIGHRPPAVPRFARDERPGGVGASAPAGRRSPPRHAALTPAKQDEALGPYEESRYVWKLGKNGFP